MFVEHKEVGEVIETPAKVLKLSEAMRIGAKLRPQGHGAWFSGGRSCAIGAAFEGRFGRVPKMTEHGAPTDEEKAAFDAAFGVDTTVGGEGSFYREVWSRNDQAGWSRELIAGWLEAQGY